MERSVKAELGRKAEASRVTVEPTTASVAEIVILGAGIVSSRASAVFPRSLVSAASNDITFFPMPTALGISIVVAKPPVASAVAKLAATSWKSASNVMKTEDRGTQPAPAIVTVSPMVTVAGLNVIVGRVTVNVADPVRPPESITVTALEPVPAPSTTIPF